MSQLSALEAQIESAWERRAELYEMTAGLDREAVEEAIDYLDSGQLRVATRTEAGEWITHQWLKKAVLLSFRLQGNQLMGSGGGLNHPPGSEFMALMEGRMTEFVARETGLPRAEARALQKRYLHEHGTTLAGLMANHGVTPEPFLTEVHDIALDTLEPIPELREGLARLPGRRLVFTNGDDRHAGRVLAHLGLEGGQLAQWEVSLTRAVLRKRARSSVLCWTKGALEAAAAGPTSTVVMPSWAAGSRLRSESSKKAVVLGSTSWACIIRAKVCGCGLGI